MRALNDLLSEVLTQGGENPAISYFEEGREYTLTFLELYKKAKALAGWMTENVSRGIGIGILGDNCAEWLIVYFAALFSGNMAVLMDKTARGEALRLEAELSGASVFFAGKEYQSILGDACGEAECYDFERLDALCGAQEGSFALNDDAPAIVFFSSGTTGRQKAVMLNRERLLERLILVRDAFAYPEENLLMLPLYHAYGLHVAMGTLFQGKCLYLSRSQKYFLRDIKAKKPKLLSLVPSQAKALLDALEKEGEKSSLSSIMLASAKAEESLKLQMKRLGIAHIAHYGSSEAGFIAVGEEEEMASGFAGRIVDGYELELRNIDASGAGEIFVRCPGRFCRYLKDEEETAKALSGDFIQTGDIGRLDGDGRLFIVGRVKNVIVLPNGEKISPEMIEEKLLKIPGILECMVYEKNGRLAAEIYGDDSKKDSIGNSIRGINADLSLYQQINEVIFRDEPFEKTTLGKKKR